MRSLSLDLLAKKASTSGQKGPPSSLIATIQNDWRSPGNLLSEYTGLDGADFVFCEPDGAPLRYNPLRRRLYRAMDEAEIIRKRRKHGSLSSGIGQRDEVR